MHNSLAKQSYIGKWSIPLAILLFTLIGAMFLIRENEHVCFGDELRYFYKFALNPGETYFNFTGIELTKSYTDISDSMINHYQCVNGRIPLHALEQAFSSLWGLKLFYVLNLAVFILTVWMSTCLCTVKGNYIRASIIILAVFLYLFPVPGRLWLSINLALNYLWPSCMTVCYLYMLPKLHQVSRMVFISLIVLAFFTGWSNEAFAFPLSAGMVLWLWYQRKHLQLRTYIAVAVLWLGAAFMLLSPGNWQRASGATDWASYWEIMSECHLIWLLLLVIVVGLILKLYRINIFSRWKNNRIVNVIFIMLVISLLMGIKAHTGTRAMTCLELCSALLLFYLIPKRLPNALLFCIGILMLAHQAMITLENHKQYNQVEQALNDYKKSNDGTVAYNYSEPNILIRPFVYFQQPISYGDYYAWDLLGVYLSSGTTKPFTALTANTLKQISKLTPNRYITVDKAVIIRNGNDLEAEYQILTSDNKSKSVKHHRFDYNGVRYTLLIKPAGGEIKGVQKQTST